MTLCRAIAIKEGKYSASNETRSEIGNLGKRTVGKTHDNKFQLETLIHRE